MRFLSPCLLQNFFALWPIFCVERNERNSLRWCRDNGVVWDRNVCRAAVEVGDVNMLRFTVEQGCHLLGTINNPFLHTMDEMYESACRGLHVDVLRFLKTCEVDVFDWNDQEVVNFGMFRICKKRPHLRAEEAAFVRELLNICESASISYTHLGTIASLGFAHVDLLRGSLDKLVGYPDTSDIEQDDRFSVVNGAAESGSIELFDLLVEEGFPVDEDGALSSCLRGGSMALLRALVDRGMGWKKEAEFDAFEVAVREDRLEDIQECVAIPTGGAVVSGLTGFWLCIQAAEHAALRVLRFGLEQWWVEENDPNGRICVSAVMSGEVEAVKIAFESGRAPLGGRSFQKAISERRGEIVEYILSVVGCPEVSTTASALHYALFYGNLEMVKLLVRLEVATFTPDLIPHLISWDKAEQVEWGLQQTGGEFADEVLIHCAEYGCPRTLDLLYTRVDRERWQRVFPELMSVAKSALLDSDGSDDDICPCGDSDALDENIKRDHEKKNMVEWLERTGTCVESEVS